MARLASVACVAALAVLLLAVCPAHAAYFSLVEGRTRCFFADVPQDTAILIDYYAERDVFLGNIDIAMEVGQPQKQKYEDMALPQGGGNGGAAKSLEDIGFITSIYAPDGRLVHSSRGEWDKMIDFESELGGEHKVCVTTNTTRWFGQKQIFNFHLDIRTSTDALDYANIAKAEHLSELEVKVRKLNDRIESIRKDQNFQRKREARFRDTSESTNSRVLWLGVVQLAAFLASAFWQVRHLRSFFIAKKLN